MGNFYVNVALPVPINKLFTYIVPDDLKSDVAIGKRVIVPFGKQELTGIIVEVSNESAWHKLKEIKDVLDPKPIFSDEMLRLTRWISDYYFSSWGEVLKSALPYGTILEGKRTVKLIREVDQETLSQMEKTAPKKAELLKFLISRKKQTITIKSLKNTLKLRNIYSLLNSLESLGYIEIENRLPEQKAKVKIEKFVSIAESYRENLNKLTAQINELEKKSPKQVDILLFLLDQLKKGKFEIALSELLKKTEATAQTAKKLEEKGIIKITLKETIRKFEYEFEEPDKKIVLNEHQKNALAEIKKAIENGKFKTFLLYGVTGSGKTQVYIEAIKEIIKLGKSAIVLVPEISLTPQIVNRFKKNFGDIVGVLHSRMSLGERYDTWRMARDGNYKIIIGPRSAIFAPLERIGLIVVDEEQESSYKQFDNPPRYNARDVAIMRARLNNAVAILGSATPSLESYYNAKIGKYQLLTLPERVDNAKLPKIEIIDMIKERKENNKTSISSLLSSKINDRLNKGEGIIIFQNRRGYSTYIECQDCGYVEMCDNCSVTLIFHKAHNHLRCHYCGSVKSVPERCHRCNGIKLKLKGVGTQKVEDEIKTLFPSAKIIRMDLDTTAGKKSYDKIMKKFANAEADILLGTQMVAKGLDFSRVTLVGVISADIPMLIPDFRSSERTFQLLTQVSGRAGRSEKEGEVIIQTFQPQHYIFNYVVNHQILEFYESELKIRRDLNYPPFTRLILIEFKGENEKNVESSADEFSNELRANLPQGVHLLGPSPAAIPKIKRNYRYHIIIKVPKQIDKNGAELAKIIWQLKEKYETKLNSKGVKLIIDVDPQNTI